LAYRVDLPRNALRFLDRLSRGSPADYLRIDNAIESLRSDPRPRGAKKLRGRGPLYRLRVGEYRIIYAVFDPDLLVTVEEIRRRTTTTYKDKS
jgi:mRNA interferase RelE/StbE